LCFAQGAYAATLTVDDDGADCPAAGFTSIQAAVDAAATGDTVVVCPGKYAEGSGAPDTSALTIAKSLTIKGAGADLVSISPKSSGPTGGRLLGDTTDLRDGLGDVVAVVGTPAQPLTVNISGVTVDGYDPTGRPVAVEAGILFLDAKGSIVRSRVTDVVTSEGDNAYTRPGGWRGPQPGIGIAQTSAALLAPVDGARKLTIDRTRVEKYNQIGVLIDGAQNDSAPFLASGVVDWGVITASQIIGRTECVNYQGTGDCSSVGLLTSGPLFGQDGLRVTNGAYATVDSSLISQNLVNGSGAPTRNSATNNANLTLGAGVRYVAAKLTGYASGTGQVIYSKISQSNIVDNAYGAMNLAADDATAATGNPNASPTQSPGNILQAEGNWWGLRYSSTTNSGPAISPTTNPQVPENPVNGTATADTVDGGTTSNAVDFFPYRAGPQADPQDGEWPVLTAPLPIDDAAPTVGLTAPQSAAPGATIALTAVADDDIGVKQVRFVDGSTTLGTVKAPPYTQSVTIPQDAACDTTRSYGVVVTDSAGQTASSSATVLVDCTDDNGGGDEGGGTPTPTPTPTSGPGPVIPPTIAFAATPSTLKRGTVVTVNASAPAGVKDVSVLLGTRELCRLSTAPYRCTVDPTGAEVGTQALRVVVTDNAGASAAVSASVTVPKFTAKLKLSIKKGKASHGKAKRSISGTLQLPAGVTRAQGCKSGKVTVTIKRSGKSVLNRQLRLSASCTFKASISGAGTMQSYAVSARFGGNATLAKASKTRRFS